jgi:hypothetical protein
MFELVQGVVAGSVVHENNVEPLGLTLEVRVLLAGDRVDQRRSGFTRVVEQEDDRDPGRGAAIRSDANRLG